MSEKIQVLIDGLDEDDIGSLIRTYADLKSVYEEIDQKMEEMEDKIKTELKQRKWTSYNDNVSKNSVSLITQEKETVNKDSLKVLLNEEQYNQVVTKKSIKKLLFVTPKDRERLKEYGKK